MMRCSKTDVRGIARARARARVCVCVRTSKDDNVRSKIVSNVLIYQSGNETLVGYRRFYRKRRALLPLREMIDASK